MSFFGFGRKRRTTRKAVKKPPRSLLNMCKRFGIKTTSRRGGHRTYKSATLLKRACAKKKKNSFGMMSKMEVIAKLKKHRKALTGAGIGIAVAAAIIYACYVHKGKEGKDGCKEMVEKHGKGVVDHVKSIFKKKEAAAMPSFGSKKNRFMFGLMSKMQIIAKLKKHRKALTATGVGLAVAAAIIYACYVHKGKEGKDGCKEMVEKHGKGVVDHVKNIFKKAPKKVEDVPVMGFGKRRRTRRQSMMFGSCGCNGTKTPSFGKASSFGYRW